ncbi:16S rRNA (cytidine(1402)-2'-O)-methyltransferase [Mycoplasma sp. Mirounga ES2805-ORL]|uniref:16S rRNA (cytidine(1402)-2'-O)-methyltransferase n=1 Tax=Mycoplasma sp. Mirounga ES2805-ORL TaxID=754514 RepID=UPI00197B7201|nr:16S rRNA (cytidine(1402)-2'-O)-methyltransferase [Mycoplasma sp. Mirounga ES2805-ORL]QSF13397.1 16S rRNA (cytidine(1402)-2'-O)-methyltransferase [Mycoplasma sp. Mirounga ES2805-ORL]
MSKLYIIGTPIGNLNDITLRALETLKFVDIIACEDTRVTQKLLNHYSINKPVITYSKIREDVAAKNIISLLKSEKNIGVVSDAGMPLISDPGFNIIKIARDENIDVEIIPGVSALTTAFSWSALSNKFCFEGFPSEKKNKRQEELKNIIPDYAYIYFVSPHKIMNFIEDIDLVLGDEADIFLAKELTKIYEQFFSGTAKEIKKILESKSIKGEFTMVLKLKPKKRIKVNKYENKKNN